MPPVADARLGASIGRRVVATVLALTTVALTLMVATFYSLSRANIETWVQRELNEVSDELAILARDGVNPENGKRFDNPRDLLRVAVQRSVLARHIGEFAVVNGQVAWLAPETIPLRPEQDEKLVATVLPLAAGDLVTQVRLSSGPREYRIVVAPVLFPDTTQRGALVHAIDVSFEVRELRRTTLTAIGIALVAIVLSGVAVWLLLGRLLAPLTAVRRTAARLSEADADLDERIPVRGNDDLSALSVTINSMLDRLSTAVTTQKQLVNDASHELRTPLTIMRGNLELLDPNDPEQVDATRNTLQGVVDRMQRLVDDLLTLAQADRPDFVTLRPTETAALTDEVAELARSLGDRRWQLDHIADVTAALDPDRLTQAMLQLAQNAVKYSEPGSMIRIGSRRNGDRVDFYVLDQGIGIPEADLALVRERFGRARSSGGKTGSGLGLAIVESIARAHGGELLIDSTEGVGSRFTISTPVEVAHDDDPDR